jgi:threonine/homoserine/homoserine lactone efflux protein
MTWNSSTFRRTVDGMLTFGTEGLLPFTIFAFAGALTPGPNNTIAMLTGAHRGLRAVLPHLLGVPVGFALMTALTGTGLGALLVALPAWNLALQACGTLYLLYLAWRLASSPVDAGSAGVQFRELTFLQSVAFQFSNPKAWALAFGTVTTFAAQSGGRLAAVIAIWSVAILLSIGLWAATGQALIGLLASPARRRAFNVGVAALLAATAIAGLAAYRR